MIWHTTVYILFSHVKKAVDLIILFGKRALVAAHRPLRINARVRYIPRNAFLHFSISTHVNWSTVTSSRRISDWPVITQLSYSIMGLHARIRGKTYRMRWLRGPIDPLNFGICMGMVAQNTVVQVPTLFFTQFSRVHWTWPLWVICAPAFTHKIGNAAHSGVSEVLFFTKFYIWKKQRLKKWTSGRPLCETIPTLRQFKMADNRNYNFSMWPDNVLTILYCFLAAIPSLKVS